MECRIGTGVNMIAGDQYHRIESIGVHAVLCQQPAANLRLQGRETKLSLAVVLQHPLYGGVAEVANAIK